MGLKLKYFVLNPTSSDKDFAEASQIAMLAFADAIRHKDLGLAYDLEDWVRGCKWDEDRIDIIGHNSPTGDHYEET